MSLLRHFAQLRISLPLLLVGCAGTPPLVEQPPAAQFHWFEYQGSDPWFDKPATGHSIRNPVLAGFYPDPSIVRAGDDYYLVNSSFAYFPGIPIFHSKDLVNWTQVGHVLDRPSQLKLDGHRVSRGIFAPTIRYHDGVFYMITTLIDTGGNFYVTATDPAGPWSDPVWLPEVGGIDPSIYFDDDGRSYVLNNDAPNYEPLYDGHRAIWIQELDVATGKIIGPSKMIIDGGVNLADKPIWIEAPHIIKVNDWYYLIAAEGGTAEWHSEVVFRSRDVFGPYVPGPANPILTQRTLDPQRPNPVTSAGHADFIKTPQGEWWSVFLGCRPYSDNFYNTGRETFMLPVDWIDGWPMILEQPLTVPAVVDAARLPKASTAAVPLNGNFTWRDDFAAPQLSPLWVSLRFPPDEWLSLLNPAGSATLTAQGDRLSEVGKPAFLGRRQQHTNFTASTALTLPPSEYASAGMTAFHNEMHHFYLGVRQAGDVRTFFLERVAGGEVSVVAQAAFSARRDEPVHLKISGVGGRYDFAYSHDGATWTMLAQDQDATILSTRVAGGFVGTMLGLHARSEEM